MTYCKHVGLREVQPVMVFSAVVVILTLYYKISFTFFSHFILASFLHQRSYVKLFTAVATTICTLNTVKRCASFPLCRVACLWLES